MRSLHAWLLAVAPVLGGCGFQHYAAQPLEPQRFVDAFQQRRLDMTALGEFMSECGLPREPWPRPTWDAPALGCAALFFDPGLARARAAVEVARAREEVAAQGQGIGLATELEHHSRHDDGSTPWSVGADLELDFEAPGKRDARVEGALARTDAAEIALEMRARALRRQAAERLLQYAEARQRLALLDSRVALLRQTRSLLERRRDVGYASPFELATVTGELQRAELAEASATAAAAAARDAIAAGLGVPAVALQNVELGVDAYTAPPPPLDDDLALLQARALIERGDIRLSLQDYAVAEAALKEAVAAQYPDFTLSPGYLYDQADRVWRFAAALVLPPGGRNSAVIAEARTRRAEAARAVEETQAAVIGEVRAAAAADRAAHRAALQAERLLVAAETQEQVAGRRLERGEGDRLALVHARLATLDARLRRAELIGAAWRARLRLETAVAGAPGEPV